MNTRSIALIFLLLSALPSSGEEVAVGETSGAAHTIRADCSNGQTLTRALERAAKRKGAVTVQFRGTCEERVVIGRDDLTLEGADSTATLVGSVMVDGVSRVSLQGFTVRDTPGGDDFFDQIGDGIRVISSQKVVLRDLTVRNTAGRGVSIEESTADLFDVSVLEAKGVGLIGTSAAVQLNGLIEVIDGDITGVCAAFGSHFFFEQGAEMVANGNLFGVLSEINSTLTLPNNTKLTANGNDVAGLAASNEGIILYANSQIELRNNGFAGIFLGDMSNLGPFAETTPTLDISDNGFAGVWVERSSVIELKSGTVIENNGVYGIFAEDSRVLLAETTIRNHPDSDANFSFGTRVSFNGGNSIASPVVCDSTVIAQGDLSCGTTTATPSAAAIAAREQARLLEATRRQQLTGGR